MTYTPSIRTFAPHEWGTYRDLRLRALADSPDAFGSTLERETTYGREHWLRWIGGWGESDNALFVGVEGETWAGMAVGAHHPGDELAHLYGMWVDPERRGRGIGRALVDAVLGWAAARDAAAIELGVTTTNDVAVAFYRASGFVETGDVEPLREGSPLELFLMRRPLP